MDDTHDSPIEQTSSDQGGQNVPGKSGNSNTANTNNQAKQSDAAESDPLPSRDVFMILTAIWMFIWRRIIMNGNFWTPAATVVIALATVTYTHYARKQWSTMQGQLDEMKSTAEFTKEQTIALEQAVVEIQQFAFVSESPINKPALGIDLRNTGHATATEVSMHGTIVWKNEPRHLTIGKPIPVIIESPALPHNGIKSSFVTIPGLTPEIASIIYKDTSRRTFEFRGKLAYSNGFDQYKSQDICKVFFARTPHIPTAVSPGNTWRGWVDCDDFPARVKWWNNFENEQKKHQQAN